MKKVDLSYWPITSQNPNLQNSLKLSFPRGCYKIIIDEKNPVQYTCTNCFACDPTLTNNELTSIHVLPLEKDTEVK